MLRTNLATRPFYNERLVQVSLGAVTALVVALSVLNTTQIVRLSARHADLAAQAARAESETRALAQQTATLRAQIRREELERLADAAREANALIDRRVFSWTALFNHLESTLPPDAMLTTVRPQVDEQGFYVQMVVVGRRIEDIDRFMENLEATGAFTDLLARQEEKTDEGFYRATLRGRYAGTMP